jgi:hypothetical protein
VVFQKKVVKEIDWGIWGHMVNDHKIDVVELDKMRYVDRDGTINDGLPVTLIRIFMPNEVAGKGIKVTGWETFDDHPGLILYEGYLKQDNKALMVKKTHS